MPLSATFLHVTDAHVAGSGTPLARDDHKVEFPGITQDTREDLLTLLFERLAERFTKEGRRIDGVLFSGDAQDRGRPGGHKWLFDLLLKYLGPFGVTADKIVATPGNHDVPRDTAPSSANRYLPFTSIWGAAGCVMPWLDGIDKAPVTRSDGPHRLLGPENRWVVYPVNTSNWCHVTSILPEPLRGVWDELPELSAKGDSEKKSILRKQLEALARYDMARVSSHQLEALKTIVASTPQPAHGRQLRIAMMHHHLRSPTLREELKPFGDISNLEQVRAFLRDSEIGIVVHGHKHEHAAYFDHIYSNDGEIDYRTLIISGATFEPGREGDAVRLITLSDLPHTPTVAIERIALPRAGADIPPSAPIIRRLWAINAPAGGPVVIAPGAPVVVEGSVLDEVYEKACKAASAEAAGGTLVVHLDLPNDDDERLPLPAGYPTPFAGDEIQRWLRDLVTWWQLDRSRLEHRIPFVHGARLRRYGGKIDQIERIIKLLRSKPTTRAVAVLIDPFRDFGDGTTHEEFASFCLIEFRRVQVSSSQIALHAIAFYRAQEFARWWPINIAEIRLLQREMCQKLGFKPGRITTIAADARTISRSPTQVAMPIIDRWLDQAPEQLHLLANALVYRSVQGDAQCKVLTDWYRTLSDLRDATQEFNSDGIPVAIEGLNALASYINVAAEPDDEEARRFARLLSDLARINASFERSSQELADFRDWSSPAEGFIAELQRLTKHRLQVVSS